VRGRRGGDAERFRPDLSWLSELRLARTFLAMTGYEQVRSIAAELAGDHVARERVELIMAETGVCGGGGLRHRRC
jgi:hypothetical protein